MSTVVVLLIIAGCAGYQYVKGNIVRAVGTTLVALTACFIALGYFEYLARLLAGFEALQALGGWMLTICFALLFLICFALFQTGLIALLHEPINLGDLAEKIGRPISGALLGWVVSGVILIAAGLAPINAKYPYARFDERNPRPDSPNKAFLNPDGTLTGWFGIVSKGSFRVMKTPKSFAVMRASFLDQLYLNRHLVDEEVSMMTSEAAIDIPAKEAVWPAPETLVDTEGQPFSGKAGHRPMLVRMNIRQRSLKQASPFTFGQIRVVCKPDRQESEALAGAGLGLYPVGYMSGPRRVTKKRLAEKITLMPDRFDDQGLLTIDLLFDVPNGYRPVLAQFKLNNAALLPAPLSADQAPQVIPFRAAESESPDQPEQAPAATNETRAPEAQRPEAQASNRRGTDARSDDQEDSALSDLSQSVVGPLD